MDRACTNCATPFTITSEDKAFYTSAGPVLNGKKYPLAEPTLCPACMQQRRIAWRNERFMYRRTCDSTGKSIVSMYPPDSPFIIYDQDVWWGDSWDPLSYGRDFDFSRPFFEQFRELQLEVPRLALLNKNSENCDYINHSADNKNCYLSATVFGCEDIYHSDWAVDHCKDLVDCSYVMEGSELCYELFYGWSSYKCFYSEFLKRCQDCWFCYDCVNCKNCFLSCNLRNKEYCYENEQLTKEAYEEKLQSILPLGYTASRTFRDEYLKMKEERAIHPATYRINVVDSTGDLLFRTENCRDCYDLIQSKDCAHCYSALDMQDSMDAYHVGWSELMYECHAIAKGYKCTACHFTYESKNALYCDFCHNSRDLFGCCGLNQKQHCILNKQYSKEEYEELAGKIVKHMQKSGEWSEFFPIEYSLFAFNQSRAMEFYAITEEEAKERGIRWSSYQPPDPEVEKVIPADKLPELISDIPDDVLNWAIRCEVTDVPFQIVPKELELYRLLGLPVPRRHPNQRYDDRVAMRTPWKLFERTCSKCGEGMQSTHQPSPADAGLRSAGSPDGKEKVYCEACYLGAVY